FLDPRGMKSLKLTSHLYGGCDIEAPMHLNQYLHISTNCIIHGLNELDHALLLSPLKFIETRAEGIELEGSIALLEHPFGRCMELLGCPFNRVPAIGIGFNPIANSTAEQFIHR